MPAFLTKSRHLLFKKAILHAKSHEN